MSSDKYQDQKQLISGQYPRSLKPVCLSLYVCRLDLAISKKCKTIPFNANNSQKQDIFLATLQIDLQRRHIITHANDVQIIWPAKFALPTPYASASALNSNLDKTLL